MDGKVSALSSMSLELSPAGRLPSSYWSNFELVRLPSSSTTTVAPSEPVVVTWRPCPAPPGLTSLTKIAVEALLPTEEEADGWRESVVDVFSLPPPLPEAPAALGEPGPSDSVPTSASEE